MSKGGRSPKRWPIIVFALAIAVGITLATFPFAAKWYTSAQQAITASEYTMVANEASQELFDWAVEANENGDYKAAAKAIILEGIDPISRVKVSSQNIDLPVYPTSSDSDLRKGAGHLEGTALPVGGIGTHSVITAHSGMPTARMFDNLPKVKIGDEIIIETLGNTLTYKVTGTVTDTPEHGMQHLEIDRNKDLLTLVTCTPYGVNTHRLLVTAERVDTDSLMETGSIEVKKPFPYWIPVYVTSILVLGSLTIWMLHSPRKKVRHE